MLVFWISAAALVFLLEVFISAISIVATPHCGVRIRTRTARGSAPFRLTSALTKFLPLAVVRASPNYLYWYSDARRKVEEES